MLLHHQARKLLQLLICPFLISYVHGDLVFFAFCSMITIKYFHSSSFAQLFQALHCLLRSRIIYETLTRNVTMKGPSSGVHFGSLTMRDRLHSNCTTITSISTQLFRIASGSESDGTRTVNFVWFSIMTPRTMPILTRESAKGNVSTDTRSS